MKFLTTLFWVVIAVFAGVLAVRNWRDVTLDLWGDLQLDIKIPVLLVIMLLIGFLPAWLMYRARLWRESRRGPVPVAPPVIATPEEEEEEAR